MALVLAFTGVGGVAEAAGGQIRWHVAALPIRPHAFFSFAEPGIAAGSERLLVADAATANTGAPPTFWLSRNDGASWSPGTDFDPSGASTGDADAAIGPDEYMYALNLAYNPNPPGQPSNPTVLVYRSRDGRDWSGPASFPAPHGVDQPDRPWLAVDPHNPGNVDVVNSEGGGNFVLWRSTDHGANFAGPYPVSGGVNSQAGLALSSRPLFDPTRKGRLFVLYDAATPGGGVVKLGFGMPLYEFPMTQLWLATSTDDGLTWSNELALDTAALTGSLRNATIGHLLIASAVDAKGNLYAAFSLRPSGATRTAIYLIRSTDHGSTWSAPARVDSPENSNVMTALAVTPAGVAYLSWYASADPDFRDHQAQWVEMAARSPDPLATPPAFTVSQVSAGPPVHVGGIDTAGTAGSDTGANWGLRDFQSVSVDDQGRPHLVWADDNHAQLTFTAYPALRASRISQRRRDRHR